MLQDAVEAKVLEEPNQMALASADSQGVPSVRMVLLKGYDERGFMFYTNYDSRKARELANGHAALCMYWEPLQRQVSADISSLPCSQQHTCALKLRSKAQMNVTYFWFFKRGSIPAVASPHQSMVDSGGDLFWCSGAGGGHCGEAAGGGIRRVLPLEAARLAGGRACQPTVLRAGGRPRDAGRPQRAAQGGDASSPCNACFL